MEAQSGKENETRHFYNFIVMTTLGLYSVQCDVGSGSKAVSPANVPEPIEIVSTYQKRENVEIESAMAVYTCFSDGE